METSLNIVITKILTTAAKRKASNIHLTVGAYPALRIDEELVELRDLPLITHDFIKSLVEIWLDSQQKEDLAANKEITLVKELGKKFRLKVDFFFQKKFLSAALRIIPDRIPPLINLGLPKSVYALADKKSGLVIVTGPYGSGRTTTVAALINEINKNRKENIVTLEQPIEYIFTNEKSLIEQRQVGRDVNSFADGLDYVQQADVDVVSVGINQEAEVTPLVLEFANSGRLALLLMATASVVKTIEEIFSHFPPAEQTRAQLLLSDSLLAIIAQRLVPKRGGGVALAAEVLIATEPVRSLITADKIKQLTTVLQTSRAEGMLSLDQSLAELVMSGEVLIDQAVAYASDPDNLRAMAKS